VALAYQQAGLQLSAAQANDPALVRALQRDLRQLGYLGPGIDGAFGAGTTRGVRALQYDLVNNRGQSSQTDGPAPVAIADYNRGRVTAITGVLDQALAACVADLVADAKVPKLPSASDPRAENKKALSAIAAAGSAVAPMPFLVAITLQESGSRHFAVPSKSDEDTFVMVGLDHKFGDDAVTSRGYGIGQYTLFHHPPRPEEIGEFILDPVGNAAKAYRLLRSKFDALAQGQSSRAQERDVEHPLLPLRLCRYPNSDARYMRDCRACAAETRKLEIVRGTPVYDGASISYQPDQYYKTANYSGVPDRADFLCDWPYAVRRYNGAGGDSYHYQSRVLLNLLAGPARNGG